MGELVFDISYGGNFYAILEPQKNFAGLEAMSAGDVLRLSPIVRRLVNDKIHPVHPENPTIKGVSHVMWTGKPRDPRAHARNAVFYGDKAIDRSPCGTGTSARMAQLAARGKLKVGDDFVHESIIGSLFDGRVEGQRASATTTPSCPRSPAGRASTASTPSSSTTAIPSRTASRSLDQRAGIPVRPLSPPCRSTSASARALSTAAVTAGIVLMHSKPCWARSVASLEAETLMSPPRSRPLTAICRLASAAQ